MWDLLQGPLRSSWMALLAIGSMFNEVIDLTLVTIKVGPMTIM